MSQFDRRLPSDIVALAAPYKDLCGKVFYHKTSEPSFYFRVSVSSCYNSTAVFLTDETGNYKYIITDQEKQALLAHTRKCSDFGNRWCLYCEDDLDDARAIWSMSSGPMAIYNLRDAQAVSAERLLQFESFMNTHGTTVDSIKAEFTKQFCSDLAGLAGFVRNSRTPEPAHVDRD